MDTIRNSEMRGYTLIELMTTLAVAATLLTVGVPSFKQLYKTNKEASVANSLVSRVMYARSEAIKRGVDVIFCPSNPKYPGNSDQSSCTDSPWSGGFIAFADDDGNREVSETTDENGNTVKEDRVILDGTSTYLTALRYVADNAATETVKRFGFSGTGTAAKYYENTSVLWSEIGFDVARCITAIGRLQKNLCPGTVKP